MARAPLPMVFQPAEHLYGPVSGTHTDKCFGTVKLLIADHDKIAGFIEGFLYIVQVVFDGKVCFALFMALCFLNLQPC